MKILGLIKKKKEIHSKDLYTFMHSPTAFGILKEDEDNALITGEDRSSDNKCYARIDFLLSKSDTEIVDAKFLVKGPLILTGFLETLCQKIIRKKFYLIENISAAEIEKEYSKDLPWTVEESNSLNLALSAFDEAIEQVYEKKVLERNRQTPIEAEGVSELLYPHWETLTKVEKIDLINKTIDEEIQPYIAMDGGGIEILEFDDERRLIIRYEGSCTSCPSAIGGTLTAIQDILRKKLDPVIEVIPDPDSLDFEY